MRHFLLLSFCFLLVHVVHAQHYNAWLRGTLSGQIDKNWSTDAELQLRRQNNPGSSNPFEKQLLYAYRHWIYYKYSEGIRFAVSPFAYYQSYNTIITPQDAAHTPAKEYRFTMAAEMKQPLGRRFYLAAREMLEYRMFDQATDLLRLRSSAGLGYTLDTHWAFIASYEILVNAAGISKEHFFDQDRLGISVRFTPAHRWKLEAGYLHVNRLPRNADEVFEEHDFFLNLTYRLPHRKSSEV